MRPSTVLAMIYLAPGGCCKLDETPPMLVAHMTEAKLIEACTCYPNRYRLTEDGFTAYILIGQGFTQGMEL